MNPDPKISVIIPVYKVEPYLRQCLDSVVEQTYRNLEIILIDDGSPDNCGSICDEYAARDERIIVVHKENEGLPKARNEGLVRATGQWITFMDSDDWCERDYYEKLLQCPEKEDADILCANGYIGESEGCCPTKRRAYTAPFVYESQEDRERLMIKLLVPSYSSDVLCPESGMGSPWDKIFKADFLRRNDLRFDASSKAWEDVWFNFQAFDKADRVVGVLYTGYHYRMVATSITKGYNPQKPQINYDLLVKLHTYLGERAKEQPMSAALEMRALSMAINAVVCYHFHPLNKKKRKDKFQEMFSMVLRPYFYDAVYSKDNSFLSMRDRVWKYGFRMKRGGGILLAAFRTKKLLRRLGLIQTI